MALRSLRRRFGKNSGSAGTTEPRDSRVRRAAVHVVEALEDRRMLSMSAEQIRYQWNHLPQAVHHELAVYEYIDPQFQIRLNQALAQYGLQPISPEAGTLAGQTGDGRSRRNVRRHPTAHPQTHVHPHLHRHRHPQYPLLDRDAAQGPIVTDGRILLRYPAPHAQLYL